MFSVARTIADTNAVAATNARVAYSAIYCRVIINTATYVVTLSNDIHRDLRFPIFLNRN